MGENVSAGVGEGMSGYDFASDVGALATSVEAAITSALPGDALSSFGTSAAEGLASALSTYSMISDPSNIRAIASYLNGSGKVAFANRTGGFYFARIVNQIPFDKILRGNPHRSFAVNFRCKPFWYQENVPEITVTASGTFVNNPGSVFSESVITVHGSGEITLMVGMTIVELDGITDNVTKVVIQPNWRYL